MRIIKVKPQGYCGGVLKAIDMAKQARKQYPDEKSTILGNLVHNAYVKKALEQENIQTIEDSSKTRLELLDAIHEGIVIFTAHGIHPQVKEKAIQKGLHVIDASCPFVLQTQKIVQQKLQEGFDVLYIGKYRHPEAESIYTLSAAVHLVQNTKIPNITNPHIFVTNQTTMSIEDIDLIFQAIKAKYPQAVFHDEICNATRIRQQAILDLKDQAVDALIVVGDPSSNNTQKLLEIGKSAKIPLRMKVQTFKDIDLKILHSCSTIAVTSGASTPPYLTNQVIAYLQGKITKKEEIQIGKIL